MNIHLIRAADVLLGGGVIAYPTEGVFGLGCMPDDDNAILRLLAIKARPVSKGLILIAASRAQLEGWVDERDLARIPEIETGRPVTWITKAGRNATPMIRGDHSSIAVRLTDHRLAASLCRLVDSPLVSTSANRSGRPTVRNKFQLRRSFASLVDYILPGDCGPATGASEIRQLSTQQVLRSARR